MDEPSVLDYVKSKLAFWRKSEISIPAPQDEPAAGAVEEQPAPVSLEQRAAGILRLPWLIFLPFAIALVAQMLLEPPDQHGLAGGILYAVAAAATVAVYLSGRVVLSEPRADEARLDSQNVRVHYAVAGLLALFASYILFSSHLFSAVSLLVWLAAVGAFIAAFLETEDFPTWQARMARVRIWLRQPAIHIPVGAWVVTLFVVCGVIVFFRFKDLSVLPMDMFSDHAEKLYDIGDVLNGQYKIFFERNTGREAFQFYWTVLMIKLFNTGISFLSLKIGTVIAGLITLYYIYRLGDELGGRWVGLYALFFAGVAYWANIISRIGLRFPLYPFCVAPVMFYLMRGLRTNRRNDFIWAGLWLGIGLHGYTASRIVPFLVLTGIFLYLLHRQSAGRRWQVLAWSVVLFIVTFAVFMPLFRFAIDFPTLVNYRSLTRITGVEDPIQGSPILIFISNTWNALRMFFWNDGEVWVHSIPYRPALDVISAGLFFTGAVLVAARYFKRLHWRDLFLLASIPILLLPSILSLAFPRENPNLNRTAGAYVPVFLITAIGFDALVSSIRKRLGGGAGLRWAALTGVVLAVVAMSNNYQLVFVQYRALYNQNAWNTTEIGQVVRGFAESVGTPDTAYVVGYPYWVDTRLVGINAGYPGYNPEIRPEDLATTTNDPRAKLFILNTKDAESLAALRKLYPLGRATLHESTYAEKSFILFNVPAQVDLLP